MKLDVSLMVIFSQRGVVVHMIRIIISIGILIMAIAITKWIDDDMNKR